MVVQQRQRFRSRLLRARTGRQLRAPGRRHIHYDGVIRSHNEPAIIAICGIGPVNYKLVDLSKPGWRAV